MKPIKYTILTLVLSSCTTQSWYTGLQESQRQECRQRYPDAGDQQKCMDAVNRQSYEKYQRERNEKMPDQP